MALYDWNHDGKNDSVDNFIEYQIYHDCTGNSTSNSGDSSHWWVMVLFAIIVGVCPPLGLIILLGIMIFG